MQKLKIMPLGRIFLFLGVLTVFCVFAQGQDAGLGMGNPTQMDDPVLGGSVFSKAKTSSTSSTNDANDASMFEAVNESLYVVGPGDVFFIGHGLISVSAMVNPEGDVVMESIPPLRVS